MTGLIIFGSLLIGMFMGLPVCFALLAACLIYLIPSGIPLTIVPQTMIAGMNSFVLLAIPLFTMTGYLMEQTSLSRRLVDFVEALFCRSRGSMGVVTIVTCAIFAALTGSGPATVAAIGAIMMPALTRANYPKSTSAGMIAAGGALGPIIPPSANMVVYGAAMGLSVSKMFIGGVLPGIMMAIALCLVNVYLAAKYKFAKSDVRYPKKEVLRRTARAIPTLVLPVIILGGIYSGFFTPTEAAVVSVFYGLVVGVFVYREIKLKDLKKIFYESVLTMATVLLIMSASTIFGWILAKQQIPQALAKAFLGISDSKYVFLLLINVMLLVVGMVCEAGAAMVILAPLLAPIAQTLGIDLIHFGIIMMTNLAIGMMTPPVGVNLYVVCDSANVKIEGMMKYLMRYFAVLIADLLIITYFPPLSLLIPTLLK